MQIQSTAAPFPEASSWCQCLTQAQGVNHQYIYSEDNQTYHTAPAENLTEPRRKLTVSEIVEISNRIINDLESHAEENKPEVETLEYQIYASTRRIIEARLHKREENTKLNFWRKLSGALSFIGIGLPFWVGIKISDHKFYKEIESLQRRIVPEGIVIKCPSQPQIPIALWGRV